MVVDFFYRFSKIVNSQKNRNTQPPQQPTQQRPAPAKPAATSVFSRLRGSQPPTRATGNIKHRLGKTVGIKKTNNKVTPNGRIAKRGVVAKRPVVNAKNKKPVPKGNKKVVKKPATAEELDRALDSYMMKDPKTAQARLDDDMAAYMAEAEDLSMTESL